MIHRQRSAEGFQSLIREALIRSQGNSDLDDMARKDVRREVLISTMKARTNWIVEDSLAPRKTRTGSPLLTLQIHIQNKKNMLHDDNSEEAQRTAGGIIAACEYNRHASDFNPGSVTFVGR